jgi:hypothetical protein
MLSLSQTYTGMWMLCTKHIMICKSHITGSLLMFGRGATASSSTNQKTPSKSSSESEIITLYDKSSNILWIQHFVEAQSYEITINAVYQDKISTLSLAKIDMYQVQNVPNTLRQSTSSSATITIHMNLISSIAPPKDVGWADILTKPLQGAKFRTMSAFLMSCPVDYSEDPPFVPSPLPTLNPTLALLKPQKSKITPTMYPTSCLMKPQISTITPSSRVC